MFRKLRVSAVALCCVVAGVGLVGCDSESDSNASKSDSGKADSKEQSDGKAADKEPLTGTKKIKSDGGAVNVSCSGEEQDGKPVIVLLHGGGDGLKKLSGLQKNLSGKNRVCSYDRLGAGESDKPGGPQTLKSTGKVLTTVLDRVAGEQPVVLAGHSLGGLIAGRYAPDHQERVKGLVLLDATSPTQVADLTRGIPESAKGQAGQVRAQTLSVLQGGKPERLTIRDGKVRSAGDIPVEVIKHGKPYLKAVPKYGSGLERSWSKGQRKWLGLSSDSTLSTAEKSGHYVYLEQPDVAIEAIERVAAKSAD